jgi:hypothetical protein
MELVCEMNPARKGWDYRRRTYLTGRRCRSGDGRGWKGRRGGGGSYRNGGSGGGGKEGKTRTPSRARVSRSYRRRRGNRRMRRPRGWRAWGRRGDFGARVGHGVAAGRWIRLRRSAVQTARSVEQMGSCFSFLFLIIILHGPAQKLQENRRTTGLVILLLHVKILPPFLN